MFHARTHLVPRCSSFNSHYKGCVRAYRLAACNAVHFTFTAGGWGQCGMLMWPTNVPSTTTTVPQEV
ncbi:hypothetical protein QQF64_032395 [Cirrhinus molitorella]|uniref:Uncharacterized protein n=1 Tax=Cirrhinus molitorella TaxID=172907 RepID=A0ABR3MZV9_9TELE